MTLNQHIMNKSKGVSSTPESASSSPAKPFLRWAGSKRALLTELQSHFPDEFDRYVEPFAGSACLFFRSAPERALLSDLNTELIETYVTVRASPEEVGYRLASMPVSKEDYYTIRKQKPSDSDAVGHAARFIYLNRFCFNGLYRTNLKGDFNVPFGRPKTNNVPTGAALRACAERLAKADLKVGDFEKTIACQITKGDLVYLDPPYFHQGTRIFREYYPDSFGRGDLDRFVALLRAIDEIGAKFIVSYASFPDTDTYFSKWNSKTVTTQRNISGFAKHRRKASEIIVTNY
jgi:DNA adenine methylase